MTEDSSDGKHEEPSGNTPDPQEVTQLLRAWSDGDREALEKLTPLVYRELHRRAHWHMSRERADHTLQTTALVNEIYVRLVDLHHVSWRDRAHIFAISSRLIRHVLIDAARSKGSLKRGGDSPHTEFDEGLVVSREPRADLVALDDALGRLALVDPRKSQVVELRFFGGLTVEEAAEVLKVSPDTIKRDWQLAKAWLRRELRRR
jgi:RNA polymerase sigma factor (TIGR02999 family)